MKARSSFQHSLANHARHEKHCPRSTTGAGFNSIGLHNSSQKGDDQLIWKVFSPEPLTAEQSKKLFPNGHKCETVGWWAYPQYEVGTFATTRRIMGFSQAISTLMRVFGCYK